MMITMTVEITEKDIANALLPNGGKITSLNIKETKTTTRRGRPPKPKATSYDKTQKKVAAKK